ncbi:MAG: hypothetical protein A3C36_06735 [Omnitrophica WOR_2 bacterium RIFCSPHIGHO2_02_FULL_52_10]|nr:MAG: hypothetical protein A3C36_06735 [Omnitrophica WOR_2 bacterium RIFCSPHIGHO2_02_FULL_52_10]
MIPKDLFKKIKRIEISTNRLVTDVFAGQYHSVFKGQGIEFEEVREYQPGDDVRTIDWNVTARTGKPHIKKFVEERELTVMIMVDVSLSCRFASVNMLKSQLAAEVAAVLAFSAIRNNDKVGLIIFTDKIEKFVPPRKGLSHVLHVIREVLYFKPEGRSTDIPQALEYLNKVASRKSIAFVISDFFPPDAMTLNVAEGAHNSNGLTRKGEELKKSLSIANKRHDIIAITLNDQREMQLPECGLVVLEDAETGKQLMVDSTNAALRRQYNQDNISRLKRRERFFRAVGVDFIDISTGVPYTDAIVKFFLKRRRRR